MPKETTNHKLKKPLYSDNADIAVINENFDAIDELLTPSVYAQTAPDSSASKGKLSAVLGWLANRIKSNHRAKFVAGKSACHACRLQ